MLKYIAFIRATDLLVLGVSKRSATVFHRSPVLNSEEQARQWIDKESKAYPNKCYRVYDCVISFEESEEEKVETVLCDFTRICC